MGREGRMHRPSGEQQQAVTASARTLGDEGEADAAGGRHDGDADAHACRRRRGEGAEGRTVGGRWAH